MGRAAVFLVGRVMLAVVAACAAGATPGDAAEPADDAPAGATELRALDAEIADVRANLRDDEAAMEAKRREALDLFVDSASAFIADYQPYRGPVPQSFEEFSRWWMPTLKDRLHYDPLEPNDAWQNRWQDTRRAEHAIYHRYEALRVALRRLERLRDRLRAQLGVPADGAP